MCAPVAQKSRRDSGLGMKHFPGEGREVGRVGGGGGSVSKCWEQIVKAEETGQAGEREKNWQRRSSRKLKQWQKKVSEGGGKKIVVVEQVCECAEAEGGGG